MNEILKSNLSTLRSVSSLVIKLQKNVQLFFSFSEKSLIKATKNSNSIKVFVGNIRLQERLITEIRKLL